MTARPVPLDRWHDVVASQDPARIADLLADGCVFRSPAVHTPQEGKELTTAYLAAAMSVLGPTLTYQHEWWDEQSAALRFTAEVDGLTVQGIDMFSWGADGRLLEFTVMIRPFTALTHVMTAMAAELDQHLG